MTADISEEDLRGKFYIYGNLLSVKVIAKRASAFIAYADRDGAEKAAAEVPESL